MLQENKVIALYCIVDDLLKGIGHREPANRKMSDSDVITTALLSALYFGGHQDNARGFMQMTGLVSRMLDKSNFCRRLHRLEGLLYSLFFQLGHYLKAMAGAADYIIDSFPVAVCHNMRISRAKILQGQQWRGYTASMRQYFYGIKVQVLTTASGIPVEFCFVPGRQHDVTALYQLPLAVAAESRIYADNAYINQDIEEMMLLAEGVELKVQRRTNNKKQDEPWIRFIKQYMRKPIETAFSGIKNLFPKKIHAVTAKGFFLKVILFIMAFTFNNIF
jgi:Transposase DDE domain